MNRTVISVMSFVERLRRVLEERHAGTRLRRQCLVARAAASRHGKQQDKKRGEAHSHGGHSTAALAEDIPAEMEEEHPHLRTAWSPCSRNGNASAVGDLPPASSGVRRNDGTDHTPGRPGHDPPPTWSDRFSCYRRGRRGILRSELLSHEPATTSAPGDDERAVAGVVEASDQPPLCSEAACICSHSIGKGGGREAPNDHKPEERNGDEACEAHVTNYGPGDLKIRSRASDLIRPLGLDQAHAHASLCSRRSTARGASYPSKNARWSC